jgi:hypothetical protein
MIVSGAAAMVAQDRQGRDLFETALAVPDASVWPF